MGKRRNIVVYRYLFCVIAIALAMCLSAGPAFGQFIVQPMRLDLPVAPNRRVKAELQLQNHSPEETVLVDLRIVDLSQWADGSWRIIEPDANDFDISKLSSCVKWMSLDRSSVEVRPTTIEPVSVTLKVPPGIRGVYSAGITARLGPTEVAGEVGIVFRFLVPVIVHVQGRTPRRNVKLTDLGMEFRPPGDTGPATTLVSMSIVNKGETYPQLRGLLTLRGYFGQHWVRIAEREFITLGILPGSELKLTGDIGRSLPPGKYKVRGALLVDGRRAGSYEKEIDFAGDPSITKLAADAVLDVSPSEIIIDSLPGASRTKVVQVYNASDEEVNVQVRLGLPAVLKGVAFSPQLKGEDLNCTQWLEIQPKKFKLPSSGRKNIRIIATMPNPKATHPCYYAVLGLFASYPDGQSAGLTTAQICLRNKDAEPRLSARAAAVPNVVLQRESEYIVSCVFGNYGDIHFTPKRCTVIVRDVVAGLPMDEPKLLSSDTYGMMLPFEFRPFSGELDFTDYPDGFYRVEVSLEYGQSEVATSQVGIKVSTEGGRRVVTTLGQEEFEKQIGVKWR